MTEEELNQTKDVMKKINENIDSAVKVIEEHKKLLKEKTKLERKNKILQGKVEYLQDVIKEAIEYMGINLDTLKTCEVVDVNGVEVYNILRKSSMPTFDEVEELFIEQREEGFNV